MLRLHLGNYGSSVTGYSSWRKREGPEEEEVSETEGETREGREFRLTFRFKPDSFSFCLYSFELQR